MAARVRWLLRSCAWLKLVGPPPARWRCNLGPGPALPAPALPAPDLAAPPEDWDNVLPLSALEEISKEEAVQTVAKPLFPFESFTLRDYVDHSETLTELVHLGVDLSKVEKLRNAGQLLLRLDFENDIKKILLFLKDVGVEDNQLGPFLTKNPYIFTEDMEALETRPGI